MTIVLYHLQLVYETPSWPTGPFFSSVIPECHPFFKMGSSDAYQKFPSDGIHPEVSLSFKDY